MKKIPRHVHYLRTPGRQVHKGRAPARSRGSTNAGLMLGQRRKPWPNIIPPLGYNV